MRLGITREDKQLTVLKDRARERGVDIVALPVTVSEPVGFEWPESFKSDGIDWVIFTSAHGVRSFFEGMAGRGVRLDNGTRYAVIGEKTGEALAEFGVKPAFVPSESYGQALFEEFAESVVKKGQTVVYARADQVNYDPTALFQESKIVYVPVTCYRTVTRKIEQGLVEQFKADDYILFTAPSAIDSYHGQFGKPQARPIAIGRSTAARMNERGWFGFITMKRAEIDNVLEYLQ